jgi:hypothetical protein
MAQVVEPGTAWYYVEGPTSTEEVREAFDAVFLNCVTMIEECENAYRVYIDMGRQCGMLKVADDQINGKGFTINGWKVTHG